MAGQQLGKTTHDDNTAKISTLMSTQGAQSFINYQDAHGRTPLHFSTLQGHATVTEHLIVVPCNVNLQVKIVRCAVDLQSNNGATSLQPAEHHGHSGISTLIQNKTHETLLLCSRVVINGLVAKPELNGRAVSFDDDEGHLLR